MNGHDWLFWTVLWCQYVFTISWKLWQCMYVCTYVCIYVFMYVCMNRWLDGWKDDDTILK